MYRNFQIIICPGSSLDCNARRTGAAIPSQLGREIMATQKAPDNSEVYVQDAATQQNQTAANYLSMPREERIAAIQAAVEKAKVAEEKAR